MDDYDDTLPDDVLPVQMDPRFDILRDHVNQLNEQKALRKLIDRTEQKLIDRRNLWAGKADDETIMLVLRLIDETQHSWDHVTKGAFGMTTEFYKMLTGVLECLSIRIRQAAWGENMNFLELKLYEELKKEREDGGT